ncbi:Ubiquitin family protein [Ophiocordyceps camponoti-floridani]|uniref:Ubiquitin family protein n=1 Tax=Ophiocordyceps camponoti-floridani TaxID=2030778 RepID=A0A8H4Q2M6_9HYPO|nr:Ubiquitin family protein [Ophiocordyceps camponoti-floridani]
MTTSDSSQSHPAEAAIFPAEQLLVNLQVVSPSVGVNRPLLFPDLPATTTIKLLKDKIRQTLPLRPTDENQRLIHRGRALVRDADSLLDVFGAEALRTLERQTIHLVIRDVTDHQQALTPPTTTRGSSPATSSQPSAAVRPATSSHAAFGPEPLPSLQRRSHFPTTSHPISQPRMPSPAPSAPSHMHTRQETFQQQHQHMSNWLGQVQRDAQLQRDSMVRALVAQNQLNRAWMAFNGIGDPPPSDAASRPSTGRGNNSHTLHYETTAPNGHTYFVDTVIRSPNGGPTGLTYAEVHHILRNADAHHSAMAMAHAMQQRPNARLAPQHRPLTEPGVTTPTLPAAGSLAGSGRATPDMDPRLVMGSGNTNTTTPQPHNYYLLSSAEGPQALLLNPPVTDTFYLPRVGPQGTIPNVSNIPNVPSMLRQRSNASQPAAPTRAHTPPEDQQPPPPRDEAGNAPPARHAVPPVHHPNNPPAAALPPLVIQLWPHLWLIFRLGLFVWFFTSPNSSWSRWLTIIGLAVFVFVMSTGLLNGMAENVWRPIGRHLETLLPALEHPLQGRAAAAEQRGDNARRARREGGSSPEQLAARLVAENRARPGWLIGQFRRLERSALLFLASLAPGVAERHIANLEAEARAEEARRREATEAAAAAAAEAANEESMGDGSASHEMMAGEMESPQPAEQQSDDERQGDDRSNAMPEANRESSTAL